MTMPEEKIDVIELARTLVRCESVTPDQAGTLDLIEDLLNRAGFTCHRLPFGPEGPEQVDNLYARYGEGRPHLCFAGHVDVVPAGDADRWSFPPFAGEVKDGDLLGRGAADMKGAVAAFVGVARELAAEIGNSRQGSVSLLLTADEEGPAHYGTKPIVDWLRERGEDLDFAIVGEPTSEETLGDTAKIGRRGSLYADVTVHGIQGHVAYPQKAQNPVPILIELLKSLPQGDIDEGTENFAPSRLELTELRAGTGAYNVIPAVAFARLSIRFNDQHSCASLEQWLRDQLVPAEGRVVLDFFPKGEAFLNPPGPLSEAVSDAVHQRLGRRPALSTSGGTSDARFIKDLCPVIELGLINKTIHAVDERASVDDIRALADIYMLAGRRLLGLSSPRAGGASA